MPIDWGSIGTQAAGGAAGTIMGLMLEGHNDQRQYNQEEKLGRLQMNMNKEMAMFNREQQMKLWEDTNYKAQVEQLKKAGLNPALLYGKGGQGGSIAATPAGMPNIGAAPKGGGEAMGLMMRGQEAALMAAQTENIKADTKKKEAETTNTGVQTQVGVQTIEKIKAETQSEWAKTALDKIETDLKGVELKINTAEIDSLKESIYYTAKQAMWTTEMLQRSNEIQKATRDTIVDTVRANLAGIYITNTLNKARTVTESKMPENIAADTDLKYEQMRQIGHNIMQGWDKLSNETKEQSIRKQLADWDTNLDRETVRNVVELLDNVWMITAKDATMQGNTIRGFHKR